MQDFNGILLTGDVASVSKTGFSVITKNVATDGTEYTDEHQIVCKGKNPAWLEFGVRIEFKAKLVVKDKRTGIVTTPADMRKAADKAGYMNLARLIGEIKHPFRYLPPTPDKQAIGNMLVTVDDQLFRGTCWGTMAMALKRLFTKGTLVQVQGRLQQREYTNRAGDPDSMLEIVCDEEKTKVLVPAANIDEFADFDNDTSPPIDAAETSPI
jgi:hypothetical protein